jgi:TatD DNase family protein
MFDTHCHLNFKVFDTRLDKVINSAIGQGVTHILIPATDVISSKKSIEISKKNKNIYSSVGIHPHHVFQFQYEDKSIDIEEELEEIEKLVKTKKVIAIGEVGLDAHYYNKTKYKDYKVDENFLDLQKKFLIEQIKIAVKNKKSLILHNRETANEIIPLLNNNWVDFLNGRTVFHCCESNEDLLNFSKEKNIFIGIDGDITYDKIKQDFIKNVPIENLVIETDSPFLIPEPLKSQKIFPNEPANISIIVDFLSNLLGVQKEKLQQITFENSLKLFNIDS